MICCGLGAGESWRTARYLLDLKVTSGPMLGCSGDPQMAIGSPCRHLLNGSSMVAVVTFHTLHPSNSKCLNNGSLFKAAHFYSATLGICSVVSLVILTAPSQGFRLTRVLGTSLCRVPSGSHYIYGLHVLKFIRRLSCSLADLLFQPTLTCQRHIPMRYRQQGLSLL